MASYNNQTSLFTLGAFIICYFIFLVFKKYYKTNIAVFGFMVYLIFVAAMVALSRSGVEENLVFSNRYKIFSLTMVMLVYISAVDLFYPSTSRRWFFLSGMILVMGFMFMVSYGVRREKLEFARYSQLYRINQWLDKNYSLYDKGESRTNLVMTKALIGGFYKVPYQFTRIPDEKYSTSVNSSAPCNKESPGPLENAFNVIIVGPDASPIAVRIEGMIYGSKAESSVERGSVYVVLRSRAGSYIFTSHSHKRTYSSIHFQKDKSNIGLISLIPINKLQNNSYQIGLCYQGRVVYSNRLIIKQEHLVKVVN
jgi:membrane protein CcdC involved in cytochrome C biogenesis